MFFVVWLVRKKISPTIGNYFKFTEQYRTQSPTIQKNHSLGELKALYSSIMVAVHLSIHFLAPLKNESIRA
jgi:hypothetical protein